MSKNLIIYYSRKGQNYWNGSIKNLDKGNTEIVAEFIQKSVGGDLFEIETVKEYSADYYECIDDAKQELNSGARPELKKYLYSIDEYEKTARVIVPENQLSLAIGKEGQNARLAAKLTGYKIDIKCE